MVIYGRLFSTFVDSSLPITDCFWMLIYGNKYFVLHEPFRCFFDGFFWEMYIGISFRLNRHFVEKSVLEWLVENLILSIFGGKRRLVQSIFFLKLPGGKRIFFRWKFVQKLPKCLPTNDKIFLSKINVKLAGIMRKFLSIFQTEMIPQQINWFAREFQDLNYDTHNIFMLLYWIISYLEIC